MNEQSNMFPQIGDIAKKALEDRGVTIKNIAELVYFLQKGYHPELQLQDCIENVEAVLKKGKCKMR